MIRAISLLNMDLSAHVLTPEDTLWYSEFERIS